MSGHLLACTWVSRDWCPVEVNQYKRGCLTCPGCLLGWQGVSMLVLSKFWVSVVLMGLNWMRNMMVPIGQSWISGKVVIMAFN